MSSQSLQGLLNIATSKAKDEPKAGEPVKNKVQTYFDIQRGKMAADPDNSAHQSALNDGDVQSATFLATLKHPAHPDHEKNLQVFKNEHEMDPRKTQEAFRAKACKDRGAGPYAIQDPAYEKNVVRPWQPTGNISATQIDFFNNMKAALQDKWNKVGYSGDKAFIENYANKYGLKRDDTTDAMQKIQPKE